MQLHISGQDLGSNSFVQNKTQFINSYSEQFLCLDKMCVPVTVLTIYLPHQDLVHIPVTQVPPRITEVVQCSIQQGAKPKYYDAGDVPLHSFDPVLPYR